MKKWHIIYIVMGSMVLLGLLILFIARFVYFWNRYEEPAPPPTFSDKIIALSQEDGYVELAELFPHTWDEAHLYFAAVLVYWEIPEVSVYDAERRSAIIFYSQEEIESIFSYLRTVKFCDVNGNVLQNATLTRDMRFRVEEIEHVLYLKQMN